MHEISILDYLRSLFKKNPINLKKYLFVDGDQVIAKKKEIRKKEKSGTLDGFILLAFFLTVSAQLLLEPPARLQNLCLFLYAVSGIIIFTRRLKIKGIHFSLKSPFFVDNPFELIRPFYLFLSIPLLIIAFLLFSENLFTSTNFIVWITGCLLFIISFWKTKGRERIRDRNNSLLLFLIPISLLIIFFRIYRLGNVPAEMFSDHAEKLLDVMDILDGETRIFFPRNTGREGLQFYITAAIIKIFTTGIGFQSLKIGTAVAGLCTLPYIFLIGKELFNKWIGLIALFLCGIGYWPNVISRVGLRFPFYPLFTAPVLYYLYKGLIDRDQNKILLAGILLGFGLHGYTPIRLLPFLVGVIILLFMFANKDKFSRSFAFNSFLVIGVASFIIFLPLFRYMLENPSLVNYRVLTRITGIEKPIEGSFILVFLKNLWNSSTMFYHKNGSVWVNSVPNRPALDVVTAVFFFFGCMYLIKAFWKNKSWLVFSLLISVPLLMMPSILSIAFPNENPALNRSAGAIVPVFLITSVGIYSFFLQTFLVKKNTRNWIATTILGSILFCMTVFQNYDLVFHQYHNQFLLNAWNSSEIGLVLQNFIREGNDVDQAYVIPFPHWVDTRLVAIHAGEPRKDYALWPEDVPWTKTQQGKKIFIVKPEDMDSIQTIKKTYPEIKEEIYYSQVPGKNFIILRVNQ